MLFFAKAYTMVSPRRAQPAAFSPQYARCPVPVVGGNIASGHARALPPLVRRLSCSSMHAALQSLALRVDIECCAFSAPEAIARRLSRSAGTAPAFCPNVEKRKSLRRCQH